ncbi:MAG: hypothetical protein HC900_06190 [Methylacidiphilales bacterium]|nr:hypothetical protein [Candidatus Methylacidiphilales bacterium]
MEESQFDKNEDVIPRPPRRTFLTQRLPFIVVLSLAILGVAYMNVSNQALVGYWEFLALATGVLCVATEWDKAEDRSARYRLIGTQALHWVAILVTMNMVLYSSIQQMMPAPATSLILLTLLALGTFLAGVSLLSLEICFLGLAMAVAVPAIAWLKQSVLFLLLGAVFLVGLVLALRPRGETEEKRREETQL